MGKGTEASKALESRVLSRSKAGAVQSLIGVEGRIRGCKLNSQD